MRRRSASAQFFARRAGESKNICIVRATLRENQAYLVLTNGRGNERSVTDKDFMQVMETFRFLDATEASLVAGDLAPDKDPVYQKNRLAFKVCLAIAAALVGIFAMMLLGTRGRSR